MEGLIEVKMEYGGLNFADLYMRKGFMSDRKLPFVLGMEGVGTITAVQNNSTNLNVCESSNQKMSERLFLKKGNENSRAFNNLM